MADLRAIRIADTTLRDGEQAPGFSMQKQQKLAVAKQLERLRVDVVEAGFAAASQEDFDSVELIARELRGCTVSSLCRATKGDIDRAWAALKDAPDPMIHIVLATSPIHMESKLQKTPQEVLALACESVSYARSLCKKVQFSAEDATRSERGFLCSVLEAVLREGASILSLPDTVGYAQPEELADLVRAVLRDVKGAGDNILGVHCHDDLGLGVANSLAALRAGASQVECTLNGIGERAGNAALEEIVMAIATRADYYGLKSRLDSTQLTRASREVTLATGVKVQPNKAIVGKNAFSHASGIHQHGMLKDRRTYEIMTPESVGLQHSGMVLSRHSGRHAFADYLQSLGHSLQKEEVDKLFSRFKKLADKKQLVLERDIEALISDGEGKREDRYQLLRFVINTGNTITTTAVVRVLDRQENRTRECAALGDGPIDAAYKAIDAAVERDFLLEEYKIEAVTGGKDALGDVTVRLKHEERLYIGRGLSTNIFEASIMAYLSAVNNLSRQTGA